MPSLSKSPCIPPGTMLISKRPLEMLLKADAICAHMPGDIKPGLTATRKRILLVTAAKAVAVVHVSARGEVSSKRPLENRVGIKRL